ATPARKIIPRPGLPDPASAGSAPPEEDQPKMGPTRWVGASCGLAREQTKQTRGRRFRAGNSDRYGARPTAGPSGRGWRRKASQSAAAAPLPANGASWTTGDPPSSRGPELPRLSYPYGACLHLRICESGSSRKVEPANETASQGQAEVTFGPESLRLSNRGRRRPPKNGKPFPIRPSHTVAVFLHSRSASLPVLAEG